MPHGAAKDKGNKSQSPSVILGTVFNAWKTFLFSSNCASDYQHGTGYSEIPVISEITERALHSYYK